MLWLRLLVICGIWGLVCGLEAKRTEVSNVFQCYSDSEKDGDRMGPWLSVERYVGTWRLYAYRVRVGEREFSGTARLSSAKHYKTDSGMPSSRFVLIDVPKGIEIGITTYSMHADSALGYADVYEGAEAREHLHSYEGCVPSGLFIPHKMDDDVIDEL